MFYDRNNLLVNDLTNKKIYTYDSKFYLKIITIILKMKIV